MVAAYVHIALKCFERVSCGADLFDSRGIGLLGGCKIGSVLSYSIGWAASLVCRSFLEALFQRVSLIRPKLHLRLIEI